MLSVGDLVKLAPTLSKRYYILESSLGAKHAIYDSKSSPAEHDEMYVVVGFKISYDWNACALMRVNDGKVVWLHKSEVTHV